ncbi:hypothetical protein ACFVDQ_42960 [Streptomyces sp. NPDC057684]|uniref:hypothetical protein n=1 Tax=Streptomyces sp. NPDC057684 TaxID=3346211 RepID=UPI00368D98C6
MEEVHANLLDRLREAKKQGWLGEVAAIEAGLAAAEQKLAAMDDEAVFGPVLYKLSLASAVSRGLLARYQIIVLELQDPVVTPERLIGEDRGSEEVREQRLGALQAALLHTLAQHDLSTCILPPPDHRGAGVHGGPGAGGGEAARGSAGEVPRSHLGQLAVRGNTIRGFGLHVC